MTFILGKKLGMSQVFDAKGNVQPVTVVEAGPIVVTQIRTKERDGYLATQVGFGIKKKLNKPAKGHLKDLGNFAYLREFRIKKDSEKTELKTGDKIDVSMFQEGEFVKVTGVSKGKGFQGVVKRHGFRGASKTHGTKHALRQPGSIGATWPQRVIKGRRMAGRMGYDKVTVKNLKIIQIDTENNLLALKGAVPGSKGSLVRIISI
ncbi:MAG: 50S ribosomal protein L3 [Parcubacteria group bacterium]|nr:50S ribosomal protein L3 [Parcubacteria group bacterium]